MRTAARRIGPPLAAMLVLSATGCTSGTPQDAPPSASEPTSATAGAAPSKTPEPQETPVRDPLSEQEQAEVDRRLIAAAWDNDLERARRLIERGADVNTEDDTEQSAYLIATSEGYDELLELTLRHGADVDAKDSFNGTGLIRAAERGHWDVVGRLIRAGVELDHVNNLGWTALHEAVLLGDGGERYLDTVRVLVAGGVDVGIASPRDGATPLDYAREKGYADIAQLLQAAAGTQRAKDRDAAGVRLRDAAAAGDADAAALALRNGARIEARDDARRTPLLLAAAHDRVRVARLLVALGADPDALDSQHDTPWLVTGVTGSVAMLETLLPADPDLTIRNRYGGISVIPASERGHVDYVRRVVRTPIDVDHVNDLGWTALLEAVILGDGSRPYQQIVRILLDAGADPAIADNDGVTALQHAEQSGQAEVATILRRHD